MSAIHLPNGHLHTGTIRYLKQLQLTKSISSYFAILIGYSQFYLFTLNQSDCITCL